MQSLLIAYDELLIGQTDGISPSYFFQAAPSEANQKVALTCIRYAIEKVLGWDKQQAIRRFDSYIVHAMKLDRIVQYIVFPDEIDKGDTEYILYLLYPDDVRIDWNTKVIRLYENAVKNRSQFPRSFFLGTEGFQRYCVCFKHLVETSKLFMSIDELYQYFLSSKGNDLLAKNRLKSPSTQFGIDIIDVIGTVTHGLRNSQLYYTYYSINREKVKHDMTKALVRKHKDLAKRQVRMQTPKRKQEKEDPGN